jgi:hypothetical protein
MRGLRRGVDNRLEGVHYGRDQVFYGLKHVYLIADRPTRGLGGLDSTYRVLLRDSKRR